MKAIQQARFGFLISLIVNAPRHTVAGGEIKYLIFYMNEISPALRVDHYLSEQCFVPIPNIFQVIPNIISLYRIDNTKFYCDYRNKQQNADEYTLEYLLFHGFPLCRFSFFEFA